MIDNKLNWMEHIKSTSRKIVKAIGIIIKARTLFESETLFNLYNALISPHISCSIQVWGTAASIHLHQLFYQTSRFAVCSVRCYKKNTKNSEKLWNKIVEFLYHVVHPACTRNTFKCNLKSFLSLLK